MPFNPRYLHITRLVLDRSLQVVYHIKEPVHHLQSKCSGRKHHLKRRVSFRDHMKDDQIFWLIISVMQFPMIIFPILYWRRRQSDIIRNRRPALFTFCFVNLIIFSFCEITRAAFRDSVGIWLDVIVESILLVAVVEAFFVFALSLYISYDKTRVQIALVEMVNDQDYATNNHQSLARSIRLLTYLLSDQFAFSWITSNVVAVMTAVMLIVGSDTDLLSVPPTVFEAENTIGFPLVQYVVMGRCIVTAVFLIILSRRLSIIQDAFGTKILLKRVGYGVGVGLSFYLIAGDWLTRLSDLGIPQMESVAICNYIMITCFVLPVLKIRHHHKLITIIDDKRQEFERFLMTDNGFDAFKAHLEKEFCIESLLSGTKYTISKMLATIIATGNYRPLVYVWQSIYRKYLADKAPLEVNLPSELLNRYRKTVFMDEDDTGLIDHAVFDAAAIHLLHLMEQNSMQRFLETKPKSWDEFQEIIHQERVRDRVRRANKKMSFQLTLPDKSTSKGR